MVALNKPAVCPVVIGRTADLIALHALIDRVKSGKEQQGQLTLISGEAGLGKSRLIAEAKIYASAQDFLLFQGNCFPTDLSYVAGRRFDFTLLQQLMQRDEHQLLLLIKELIAAQLVVEESDELFSFRHTLTRQAIYTELLARERKALHRTIAETIERLHISTLDAIVRAADPNWVDSLGLAPHCVSKLYYMAETKQLFAVYQSVFGDLVMHIDGVKRGVVTWPDWSITTRIDTWAYWRTIWHAICCHQTQVPAYHVLENLSEEQRRVLWGSQSYYRAFSLVNGGRHLETDLFEGLRPSE